MANLSVADRARLNAALMRAEDDFGSVPNLLKADLLAAVNAADAWVDANTASYVAALPEPFKDNSTANQKSLLLIAVVLMRYNRELAQRVFSGVD